MSNPLLKLFFRKKAQIQMFETIGVLFVFFFLLTFGLIFYASFQKEGLSDIRDEKVDLELVSIAQTISTLSEFKCSEQKSIKENCFDLASFIILSNKMDEYLIDPELRMYFYYYFKSSNITLDVFDDANKTFERYALYYNKDENLKSRRTNYVPITIRDPGNGELYFGVLYLTVFI